MKKIFLFIVLFIFFSLSFVLAEGSEDLELTVYNQNFALVKDHRTLELKKGINDIRFSDIAALIEPNSVFFKSLTDPKNTVIEEQNYEYDLINSDKLLFKYINKKIKVITKNDKIYEGILLSYDAENIVLSLENALTMICRKDNIRDISFPEMPEGLITKPTLMWQIYSDRTGKHLTEVSYLTGGINWNADYIAIIDKDDKKIDLSGWVTIDNKSGVTYNDSSLKLIAGDVRRVREDFAGLQYVGRKVYALESQAEPQFREKAFFEYHMYTLQRKTTLKNNQTKQISLLSIDSIPIKKLFIYDPVDYFGLNWWWYYDKKQEGTKEQKIKVKLELVNSKENNLGMPLPKGNVKVYKKDTDGTLQFIGEDSIDHTPKDEKIKLYIGDAFDVVGERKKINYRENNQERWAEENFEISLHNHKDVEVGVIVVEHLWRHANWKIINKSHEFTKKGAQAIEFKVAVPKNGETKVNYTVKYWW